MGEILSQIIAQWGIVGILACAAGYIIYDNYKTTKEKQKNLDDQINEHNSRLQINDSLTLVSDRLAIIEDQIKTNRAEIEEEIKMVNDRISYYHPDLNDEMQRMSAVAQMAPAIYSVLETDINQINADHLFVGIFHNGTKSVCGMPFLKFDIVCEKYFPLHNPSDIELANGYKDEDLMRHNLLPSVMFQNKYCEFVLTDDECQLARVDSIMYNRMVKRNIKKVYLAVFHDKHNDMPHGFVGAYSFDENMDFEAFKSLHHSISAIYNA